MASAEYSSPGHFPGKTRVHPPRSPRAVLLDAFGTLVDLEPPTPRMTALLAAEGHPHPEETVAAALRAETLFYRANHDRGRDAATLGELRRDCARIVADHLGADVPPPERLTELLVEALRFRLMPDAVPALDALAATGLPLAVVSNWDCSLPETLSALGVADRFALVATSATVGARKPSPGLFHHVLERLGVDAAEALHCGDHPEADCWGAAQAGVPAVLVDRDGRHADSACPRIGSLVDLLRHVGRAA
jgi:putative hydrolase of the HAD superfamily